MKILEEIVKNGGTLHHAYCFEGERKTTLEKLFEFVGKKLKIETQGNPDFSAMEFDALGVDEARALKEKQEKKSFGEGRKVFVVSANSMTREAQNSLLKVFEEPTPGTHFFLIMPSTDTLLPTLRSRLQIIKLESEDSKISKIEAEKFLKSGIGGRMEIAKVFAKKVSDDEMTKSEIQNILGEIEKILHEKYKKDLKKPEVANMFSELLKNRSYLSDRSSSVKMILEYLAVLIP